MSDLMTLKDVSSELGIPLNRVKQHFERGMPLEFVPRPQDPNAKWVIRRKDYDMSLAKYQSRQAKEEQSWDTAFKFDAIVPD